MLKPNIYTVMSNASKLNGKIGFQTVATMLDNQFSRGFISYYRTDSLNHYPLMVLNQNCDSDIKKLIQTPCMVDIEKDDFEGGYYIRSDKYLLPSFLFLATPTEYLNLYPKIHSNYMKYNKKPKDYERPENMFIGLEIKDRQYKQFEIDRKKDLDYNFSFENFLKNVSAEVKYRTKRISKERVEIEKDRAEINFKFSR